jgi:hypothetical protein
MKVLKPSPQIAEQLEHRLVDHLGVERPLFGCFAARAHVSTVAANSPSSCRVRRGHDREHRLLALGERRLHVPARSVL